MLSHKRGCFQCHEVETRAHAVGAPELNVIGIDMWFLYHSSMLRVPSSDAIIQARADAGPPTAQPRCVSTDPPIPIEFDNPAQLSIRCIRLRVRLVQGAYRKGRSTELMAFIVLVRSKFGFT